jgi:hemolysin III
MEKKWQVFNIDYEFTPQQELVNSTVHAVGILFGLIAVPFLLSLVSDTRNLNYLLSCAVYSLGFIMTFTSSTLFHSSKKPVLKKTFKKLDYISIYLLIAGTYTPLIVAYMHNEKGILLLYTVWLFAFLGIMSKIFLSKIQRIMSVGFYLFIGLLFLFVRESFFLSMPTEVSMLIISGVVLYCIGLVFYVWRRWFYHHAAWHLFVLLAGICHFTAILLTFHD